MAVPLDKMKKRIKLSHEREKKISQRAQMLIEEEMTLRELVVLSAQETEAFVAQRESISG